MTWRGSSSCPLVGILVVPLGEEGERARYAFGRAREAFTFRLGIDGAQERTHVLLEVVRRHTLRL